MSSHPGNVIEVPRWRRDEDARAMGNIFDFIKKVVGECPENVADGLNSKWLDYQETAS